MIINGIQVTDKNASCIRTVTDRGTEQVKSEESELRYYLHLKEIDDYYKSL